ncbi:MAG: putative DNA modification/repair radical SAM protein [Clostridiales bacterium]|nr:putative DNA modification/repair radical SAM protein [Clostridiales bacterium]
MAAFIRREPLSWEEKLQDMRESARFDVGDGDADAENAIAEQFPPRTSAPPARPSSLQRPPLIKQPKVFVSNDCAFNCSYCGCRCSRSRPRYTNSPEEMARLSLSAACNHPHRGVFITSAVCRNADYTEEMIVETMRLMREKYGYTGYIHAKIMPGADPALIEQAGWLADRLSVNIELPHSDGYAVIARQKTRRSILAPMGGISRMIRERQGERNDKGRLFAGAGQTTQLIVGAMNENDRASLRLAEALYQKYRLRRVYYSAFGAGDEAFDFLPSVSTPKWRSRRLYQADRLMQLYGFSMEELTPEEAPNLPMDLDPKSAWALRHREQFPIEINRADFEMLLRVPGLGITSAKRILHARRLHTLTPELLRQLKIPLARAKYFITCNGRYEGGLLLDSFNLRQQLAAPPIQLSLYEEFPGAGLSS